MGNATNTFFFIALLLIFPHSIFGQTLTLGTVEGFAFFTSNGALSNTGKSNVTGDIGSDIGAVSGFGEPSVLNGNQYNTDTVTAQAKKDLFIAYHQLISVPVTDATHTPAFGGSETLTPGVYTVAGAGSLAGSLTLDALGDTNALFIFRFGGAYATGASSSVILTNGARSCKVFWVAEGAITLAASTVMKGTMLANHAAVSAAASCNIEGRMLSTTGAIAFGPAIISIPPCNSDSSLPPISSCCNPNFGATIDFVIFTSNGAVSNVGNSNLTKNVGTDLGSFTGFGTATVIGSMHNADSLTNQAKTDLSSLYNELISMPETNSTHAPAFGSGEILTAGIYTIASAGSLAGNLTLDAQSDTNAVFIFKIRGAFSVAAASSMTLVNSASSCSVFWVTEGAISIGAGSLMEGTYIANNAAISMLADGNLKGRLFSTTGAIAIDNLDADNTAVCPQQDISNPLPIGLLSFEATCENQNTTLKWSTASEINNNFFTIEQTIDGINWQIISTVPGAKNSSSIKNYSFIDVNNNFETSYYRLKQTDFDGAFKYFTIIGVKKCRENLTELSLYPNPAKGFVNIAIRFPEERIVSVSIYSLHGKVIYYSRKYQSHIVFEDKLDGIYLLKIELDTKIILKKLIITN
jgi:hypothetical protein